MVLHEKCSFPQILILAFILYNSFDVLQSALLDSKLSTKNKYVQQFTYSLENKVDDIDSSSNEVAVISDDGFQKEISQNWNSNENTLLEIVRNTSSPSESTESKNEVDSADDYKSLKPQDGKCNISQKLIEEIKGYQNVADKIISAFINGSFRGRPYDSLAYFVDRFGSRLFGTANLENAIDFMLTKMTQDGLENVHGEDAIIPRWTRGDESATLLLPRKKKLSLLGLGLSVGTPPEGIIADVLVVHSFDELHSKAEQAKGRIVVFNENYVSYGVTVEYRSRGASEAAKVGAVASLIRSITPYSLNTPHTGQQDYEANVTQIPTACITIEDAELLDRMQARGHRIVIELKMNDFNLQLTTSRNVVGEIQGKVQPDEVVVVSGHIDSWDVAQGAMDDGGGMIISAEALALIKFLKLDPPRRTLRAILWTAEEPGLWGVRSYMEQHKNEMNKFNAVFESDIGTFRPLGLDFSGTTDAGCIVEQVLKLLAPINATTFRRLPSVGSDIGYFINKGVPGLSLNNDNAKYFYYHHTEADTMTVENSDELDLCTAVWAVTSYVLADLSVPLPKA